MKKTYRKILLRTMQGSFSRFAAIAAIVALGVALLSGLFATPINMRAAINTYASRQNLHDLRIVSPLGLTDADAEAIAAVAGVDEVMPAYLADVFLDAEEHRNIVTRIHSLPTAQIEEREPENYINRLDVAEGRLPLRSGECVLAKTGVLDDTGPLRVGGTLRVSETNGDLSDTLAVTEFKIVGIVRTSYYCSVERESATIGSGIVALKIYVSEEDFSQEAYSEIYATVDGARELGCETQAYQDKVDETAARVEEISAARCLARYEEVKEDGTRALDEARTALAEARAEADAQLSDAERELAEGRAELDDARAQLQDAERQLESGEAELAQNQKTLPGTLSEKQQQLADGKAALVEAKALLAENEALLAEKKQQLADAKAQLETARRLVETLEPTVAEAEAQLPRLEAALPGLRENAAAAQEAYDAAAARAELPARQAERDAAQTQADAAAGALADAQTQADAAAGALADAQARAQAAAGVRADAQQALQSAEANVAAGMAAGGFATEEAWAAAQPELAAPARAARDEAKARLEAARAEEGAAQAALAPAQAALDAANSRLAAAQTQADEANARLETAQAAYLAAYTAAAPARAALDAANSQLAAAQAAYDAARTALTAARTQLDDARRQIAAGEPQIAAGEQQLAEGEKQLADARRQVLEAEKQLASGETSLSLAPELARLQMELAEKQLTDARAQYEDGLAQWEDGLAQWEDGEAEYRTQKEDALQKLADAEAEIADAEQTLAELEVPEWMLLDRKSHVSVASFLSNVEKLEAITTVFPVFFFLVAALVALTTMTRMVEEERLQIGTLKALGYRRGQIMFKYLLYAWVATLIGGAVGVAVGFTAIPLVIWNAYGTMYTILDYHSLFHPAIAAAAVGGALVCTSLATLNACSQTLREWAAQLLLPKAPKAGKRIFLEHITPIWRRLKFTHKVTARNLLRYKKRFFMTVVGVAGCTALLVTGFGLKDSIGDIITKQFGDIFQYDFALTLSKDSALENAAFTAHMDDPAQVRTWLAVRQERVTAEVNGESCGVYLFIPEDAVRLDDFVSLHERTTRREVPLTDAGVVLTEKLAEQWKLAEGDSFTLENADGRAGTFTVTGIAENYVENYVYLTPDAYAAAYGGAARPNSVLGIRADGAPDGDEAFAGALLDVSGVAGLTWISSMRGSLDDTIASINYVVYVIILFAGLLAFVVLYNLMNINITERTKEIATIKVLGFFEREVEAYVYRESNLLALIGMAAGLVGGVFLHMFIMRTVEVDIVMFGRDIKPLSFVLSAVLTLAFSMLVNLWMRRKLRQISMVESMKAPE